MVTTRSGAVYPRPATPPPSTATAPARDAAADAAPRDAENTALARRPSPTSASTRPRPANVDRLSRLPPELLELVLDHVPNRPDSQVGSLALTRRHAYHVLATPTRLKARVSALVGRLERIPELYPPGANVFQLQNARATEFAAVADAALDGRNPLSDDALAEVLSELMKFLPQLALRAHRGFRKMLDVLEALGPRHAGLPPASTAATRRQAPEWIRADLAIALSQHGSVQVGYFLVDRGATFDRLHAAMQALTTAAAQEALLMAMPLAPWHAFTPAVLGGERLDALVRFVEERHAGVTGPALASAIGRLVDGLRTHAWVPESNPEAGFSRLCDLAATLPADRLKLNTARVLVSAVKDLPADFRREAADCLYRLVDGMADETLRLLAADHVRSDLNA